MESTNLENTTEPSLLQNRLLSDAQVKSGVDLIAEERMRQIEVEGYTPESDDTYTRGELVNAAIAYLQAPHLLGTSPFWPWMPQHFKPTPNDRVRELEKAGALIASEIDRLKRLEIFAHLINEASK
jgi:hypothetical protein